MKSRSHSPDGKVWPLLLRDGVTFSNGEPFNAPAAQANFEAVLSHRERHSQVAMMKGNLQDIQHFASEVISQRGVRHGHLQCIPDEQPKK